MYKITIQCCCRNYHFDLAEDYKKHNILLKRAIDMIWNVL